MTVIRIIAISIGIIIANLFYYVFGAPWYICLPMAIIGYALARYVGSAIEERERLKREIDEVMEKARRNRELGK